MKKLNVFVPITKVDAAKGIVYGIIAKEQKDRSGEIFDYKGSKPHFEKWSADISKATAGKSVGNLRAMHGSVAAGKLTDLAFDDDAQTIECAAKVVDKNELEKVLEGVYTGFSIGGAYEKRWKDPDNSALMRYVASPVEVSLVDLPCMPDATFSIVKADGSTELRKFQKVIEAPKEPTNDEIATEAKKLAKAAGDETKWLDHLDPARESLKKAAAAPALEVEEDDELPTDPLNKGAGAGDVELGAVQVWTHPDLPDKSFTKKADLRDALRDHRAEVDAAAAAGPVQDLLKQTRAALEERETGTQEPLAKVYDAHPDAVLVLCGAAEGDLALVKTYIEDAQDRGPIEALAKAVVVIADDGKPRSAPDATKALLAEVVKLAKAADHAAKNPPLTAEQKLDLAKKGALPDGSFLIETKDQIAGALEEYEKTTNKAVAKRHITRRARALKAEALLPEDWGVEAPAVIDLKKIAAPALAKAASLYTVSSLISMLAQIESCEESLESPGYGYGTTVPKVLCDRFGAALIEIGDIVAEVLDAVLSEMKAEEAGEAAGSVMRAAAAGELLKVVLEQPLVKVGARHSRSDMEKLNSAHDLIVDLGAICETGDDEADKNSPAELRKAMAAKDKAFSKTMADVLGVLTDIADRVKAIESQPVGGRPSSVNFRTVEKGAGAGENMLQVPDENASDANKAAFATMMGEVGRLAAQSQPERRGFRP